MLKAEIEAMKETLELLSTPGFLKGFEKAKKEVEKGETNSFEEVFGEPL